jgi:hypothetical protein
MLPEMRYHACFRPQLKRNILKINICWYSKISPLAFEDLCNLQQIDPVLISIIAQHKRGESVGEYSLRKEILYIRNSKKTDIKIVVPEAATPMVLE